MSRITVQTHFEAINAVETHYLPIPDTARKYKVVSAVYAPDTTLAAHASNNASLTLKNGSDTISTVFDTDSGGGNDSLTAGTVVNCTLASDDSRYVDGGEALSAVTAVGGTGAVDGTLVVELEEVR